MKKRVTIIIILVLIVLLSLLMLKYLHTAPRIPAQQKFFGVTIAGPEFEIAHYTDNTYKGYTYFQEKGLTMIRIPFKWGRLQPTPEHALDKDGVAKLTGMVSSANTAGEQVIIEPHNFGRYYEHPLTTHDAKKFGDLWGRLADTFKETKGIWGYELMNEPHDLQGGCETWKAVSQSAIDAIREKDKEHYILVPGYSWQSAVDWKSQSGCLADLHDPQDKLIYSAHIYFDEDKSGKYKSACTDTNIGIKRALPFLDWLKMHNKVGIFTEYGVPPEECWMTTMDNFLQHIYTHPNIIGGLYWSAGPFWGKYNLSVEPRDNQDRPQMEILKKYPTVEE